MNKLRPNKVKIIGKDYKVVYLSDMEKVNTTSSEALLGQITYADSQIRVYDFAGTYDSTQLLWHEILHGISSQLNVGLEEKQIDLMATGVANVLIDNKMLKV